MRVQIKLLKMGRHGLIYYKSFQRLFRWKYLAINTEGKVKLVRMKMNVNVTRVLAKVKNSAVNLCFSILPNKMSRFMFSKYFESTKT